jgi:hypothetical protein
MMNFKGSVNLLYQEEKLSWDILKAVKRTVLVKSNFKMAQFMKVNLKKTSSMDLESTKILHLSFQDIGHGGK